ncbi:TetR/AcrR family transcriptional regulator [Symbiobacterium thermophilum]|uniref:TetR family transcriptional regulator n=2 Tax=Symbiobacterium thermophilum TaxID=2734 RepID=Q67KA4_SYMTH|nr:TetR/AcrR family transcriptional regulator [Symbiobacterium thermophilum]MBY6275161.1 TetR family transcriptional regulator [Symbiobacterium thermophilum]BAD41894.1 TetR family transcriptional regulator [Symbiobacterium thermophilum IAM 14863]
MPKIVDHEEQRKRIAEAMWRVILRDGMEGATVRKIAAEAGMSVGALRHYFRQQDDLLVYAMRLVNERVEQRILRLARTNLPPLEKAVRLLLEVVPVDGERRAEMDVWFSFMEHVRHRPDLEGIPENRLHLFVSQVLAYLQHEGLLEEGLDLALEAERMYAIVDGLAVHALLEPERLRPETMEEVVRTSLRRICRNRPQ